MNSRFDVEKTAQATVMLLKKAGGSMSVLKLVKLLYIADRESIKGQGKSISGDRYVSMPYGPVLSHTKNLIDQAVRSPDADYWTQHISQRDGNRLSIEKEPEADCLSVFEKNVLESVYEIYGDWDPFDLVDYTHRFDEWQDPNGSAKPIRMVEILKALSFSDEQIELQKAEENASEAFDSLLKAR